MSKLHLSKKVFHLKLLLIIIFCSINQIDLVAQVKIGNNVATINSNSLLELESTSKGLLFPRVSLVSTSSASPMSSHLQGMVIYNIATSGSGSTAVVPGLYLNTGSNWLKLSTINVVSLSSSTTPAGNFIGDVGYNTNASSGLPVGLMSWNGSKWVSTVPGGIPTISLSTATNPAGSGTGQLAYNTSIVSPKGLIFWDGTKWNTMQNNDLVVGNEVTGGTTNRGLSRSGSGTSSAPYTLGIESGTTTNQTMNWDGSKWGAGPASLVSRNLTNSTNPAGSRIGELAYNTNAASGIPVWPVFWTGNRWQSFGSTKNWNLSGNSGIVPANNFIGTTDAIDFAVKTNNSERMRVTSSGNVGIGTNNPLNKLHINNGTTNGAIRIVDGTEGVGKVLTSDTFGRTYWDMPDIYKSVVTATIPGNVNLTNNNSGGYLSSGTKLTLTKGKWLVFAGLTFTGISKNFWMKCYLSSSTTTRQMTGFKFLGLAGVNTSIEGALLGNSYNSSVAQGNHLGFVCGANAIEVTNNSLDLYIIITNFPISVGSFSHSTSNYENYLYAIPINYY